MRITRVTRAVLLVGSTWTWSMPATARAPSESAVEQPTSDEVRALTERASAAFDAGDFAAAVDAFEQAYARSPEPRFLYNIARIHEEAGEIEPAIDHYRRFMGQPGVELELRERAAQRVEVLARIQASMGPAETVAPTPATVVDTPAPERVVVAPVRGLRLRNAGIGILAGGAGVLTTALITGLFAQSFERKLGREEVPSERRSLVDRGERLALATDVVLATGVALTIVGAIMTGIGAARVRATRPGRSLSLTPTGRGLAVGVAVRF